MEIIESLNLRLEGNDEELEALIGELAERQEFSCSGNYCPVDVS